MATDIFQASVKTVATSPASGRCIEESAIYGRKPIPKKDIDKLTRSVCAILVEKESDPEFGTGFLCQIQVNGRTRYGLATCAHVIPRTDTEYLQNVKIAFKCEQEYGFWADSRIRDEDYDLVDENIGPLRESYPYPDIDATFIELSDLFKNRIRESRREFLRTDKEQKEGDGILIIQYPLVLTEQILSYSFGQVSQPMGTQIILSLSQALSTASTLPGSSGSPILLMSQKVCAIHRGNAGFERNQVIKIQSLIEKLNGSVINEIAQEPVFPEERISTTSRMKNSF